MQKITLVPEGFAEHVNGMLETGMPQNHHAPKAALASPGLCLHTLLTSESAPAADTLLAVKAGKILWAAFKPDLNRDPLASAGSV